MWLFKRFSACALSAVFILLSAAGASSVALAEAATPSMVNASYRIYKAGIFIGTVDEQFTRDGDNYRIVSQTETAGPLRIFLRDQLTMTSEGAVGSMGLKPARYQFVRRDDQKKSISSEFDWKKQQILSRHGAETETFDLPAGTQDRISAMYQFMFSRPTASEVAVWMSQGKKAELYRYRKQGEAIITVNGESIPTVYYAREAKAGESKAHLWLAKEKYFLPIKILFEEGNGSTLEQILVSIQIR